MKNKTLIKTRSVTNTQIATAVAALFLAGGLAFAALPVSQKNIIKKNTPAVVLKKTISEKPQESSSSPIFLDRCGTPNGGWQSGKIYKLSADITVPQNTAIPCFVIDRDNITLDGQRHHIIFAPNATHTAIRVQNSAARVVIQNILFDNFSEVAITSDVNVTGLRILNNTFTNNKKAILLGGGNTHEVLGNTIIAPAAFRNQEADTYRIGLHLGGASNVTVRDNRFEGLLLGIFSSNASNNTFEQNIFRNNQIGVYLSFSSSNVVFNNTFDLQSLSALYIRGASASNNVSNNTFAMSGGGIFSSAPVAALHIDAPLGFANEIMPVDSTKLAVMSMDCSNNCVDNNFTGNTFNNSSARPFSVTGSNRTTILSNQINGISWPLEFTNTQNLTFRGNSIMNVINESNLINIFGAGTTQITFEDNNLCRNFTHMTVFCAREVPARTRFSSVRGNSLVNTNCGDSFVNSSICQN